MKYLIWVLLLFSSLCASAQTPVLQKIWIGKDSTYLMAGNYASAYNLLFYEMVDKTRGTQNTSLSFKTGDHDTIELENADRKRALYLLDTTHRHQLIFTPVPNNKANNAEFAYRQGASIGWYDRRIDFLKGQSGTQPIIFCDAIGIHTDTVKFENIKFRETRCYGSCLPFTIEIDKKGNVKYIDQLDKFFRFDALGQPKDKRYGITDEERRKAITQWHSYSAKLLKEQYRQLIDIIKESDLDHLVGNHGNMIDGAMYTMEISYNHKTLSFNTMTMPLITRRLIDFLTMIPSKVKLIKSESMPDIRFKEGVNVADW